MKIRILTTGGTIDKVYFDELSAYEVGDPQIGEVLNRSSVSFDFSILALFKKDSLQLTDADRAAVRRAIESDTEHERFIVTHGTDTMTASARACRDIPGKVVVFTGATQPARFVNSNAIFNIGCAVAAVQTLLPGVYIVMSGRIFDPDRVQKNRELHRFEPI